MAALLGNTSLVCVLAGLVADAAGTSRGALRPAGSARAVGTTRARPVCNVGPRSSASEDRLSRERADWMTPSLRRAAAVAEWLDAASDVDMASAGVASRDNPPPVT